MFTALFSFNSENKKYKTKNVNFSGDSVTLKPRIRRYDLLLPLSGTLESNVIKLIVNVYVFTRICNLNWLCTGH